MKKVSVIIPCYNVAEHIHQCIDSLLKQTIGLESLQLIFIDDASTDNTLDILYEYEKKYTDNIIVIACDTNGRQGTARNIGLQYAEAEYIGFVDSDDWIEQSMYEKLYKKAIEFDCDMVSCDFERVSDKNNKAENREAGESRLIIIENIEQRKKFFIHGAGNRNIWNKLYKRNVIIDNHIFFPEKLAYEDNFFSSIIHMYINKAYTIDEALYYYYINMNSTTTARNSAHHFDRLVVELMKIDYYKKHGLFETYKDEIEFQFLQLYYINSLTVFFRKFEFNKLPLPILKEMQETVIELFPEYEKNKYLDELSDIQRVLLSSLKTKFTSENIGRIVLLYMKAVGLAK